MAKERSPVKVPSENEDLPNMDNAPDFDEDTLRGELGSTLASVTVKTFSISPVSRTKADVENDINTLHDHFKGCLASHDSLL